MLFLHLVCPVPSSHLILSTKTLPAMATCSSIVTTMTVYNISNVTIIQPTTAVSTTFITQIKSVVVSTITTSKVETKTETLTETFTVATSVVVTQSAPSKCFYSE